MKSTASVGLISALSLLALLALESSASKLKHSHGTTPALTASQPHPILGQNWTGDQEASKIIDTHGRISAYRSSQTELVWLDGNRTGQICTTAMSAQMVADSSTWTTYSHRAWLARSKPAPIPTPEENAVLSHFTDKLMGQEPIEPLSGMARHPFANVGCQGSMFSKGVFDIDYIVVHNNCGSTGPKPRSILFDMGASKGFAGVPGGIYSSMPSHGGGLAPSLPLFYRLYADRCLEPDLVYAWEPNPGVSDTDFWGELPQSIRAKVHFYKSYVTSEDFLKKLQNPGTFPEIHQDKVFYDNKHRVGKTATFLKELVNLTQAEDFVSVKVDIDTPEVEHVIMQTIADSPDIAALIDEIYFEYHFYFDGMNFGWGNNVAGNVDTALGLMHRLRTLGIRSHFWI